MRKLVLLGLALLFAPCSALAETVAFIDQGGVGRTVYVSSANPLPTTAVLSGGTISLAPTSAAASGIAPVVSSSAESSHVLKSSAGNLYGVYVTTGATPGYLLVFDATSAPSNGAVTPKQCIIAPANATTGLNYGLGPPAVFATGITAVFSTTGCFTLTLSATTFFNGAVK